MAEAGRAMGRHHLQYRWTGRGEAHGLAGEAGPYDARLADLPEPDRVFIQALRLWFEGPAAQAGVWNAFASAYGAAEGRKALRAFETYLGAVAEGADRPLRRRICTCPCFGDDEAALAQIVRYAALGQRAAAIGWALYVARPQAGEPVADAALALGRYLILTDPLPDLPAGSSRPARLH